MTAKPKFIPALRFHALTGWFDGFLKATMREDAIKNALIDAAGVEEQDAVLDFGCGTGTLIKMLLERFPRLDVVGLDVDDNVLVLASEKLAPAVPPLVSYDGAHIPFEAESFDTVLTSLAVHHIASGQKVALFGELRRVLKPGGKILILDFTKPTNLYAWLVTGVLRWLEPIGDNIEGRIPSMLLQAGFMDIEQAGRFSTGFGTLAIVSGRKP